MRICTKNLQPQYDFIIVGTGILGLTILQELIKNKKKNILVIESGSFHSSDPYPKFAKTSFSKLPIKNTSRFFGVGGSSNSWGSISAIFDEEDFKKSNKYTFLPINFDEIKKWCSLSKEYGFPSIEEFKVDNNESLLKNNLAKKKFVQVKPKVSFFPKSSLLETENVDFIQNARVSFITKNDRKNNYKIHFFDKDKKEYSVLGLKTILCCGSIETIKILLNSGLKKDLPNLGHYFMNHPKGFIKSLSVKKISKCLKMLPEESDSRRKYSGIMLNKKSDFSRLSHYIRFERGYINPGLNRFIRKNNDKYSYEKNSIIKLFLRIKLFLPKRLEKIIVYLTKKSFVSLEFFAEILPEKSNMVSIKKEIKSIENEVNVDYSFNEREFQNMEDLLSRFEKYLNLKEGELSINRGKLTQLISIDSSHHLGGAICGKDKDSSVVNADLKLHNTNNIFLCSGAVFPFGGAINPTLSFVSIALWFSNKVLMRNEKV